MSCNIQQTPTELLDWTINWATRGLGNDTIASSNWAVSSADVILSAPSQTTATTTVWVSGGIPGNVYTITNSIVTSGAREMQETIYYVCIPQRMIGA